MDWDWDTVWGWLNYPWVSVGETDITLATVSGLLFILIFVWWFSLTLEKGLRRVALHGRSPETSSTVYAFTRLVRYVVWIIGTLIGLNYLGFNLASLAFLGGAIGLGIGFGSDKNQVREAGIAAAKSVQGLIIDARHPVSVLLRGFGESSLDFELRAWVGSELITRPGRTTSQLLWALEEELTQRGIEIPNPQRDIHIRSGTLGMAAAKNADGGDECAPGVLEARVNRAAERPGA